MATKKKNPPSSLTRRTEPQGEVEQCRKLIELQAVGNKVCFSPSFPTPDGPGDFAAAVIWAAIDVFELSRWKRALASTLAREAQSFF